MNDLAIDTDPGFESFFFFEAEQKIFKAKDKIKISEYLEQWLTDYASYSHSRVQ